MPKTFKAVSAEPFGQYKPARVIRAQKATPKTQGNRFIDKAREIGCDEDEKAFDDKLRRIAKAKPKKEKPAD